MFAPFEMWNGLGPWLRGDEDPKNGRPATRAELQGLSLIMGCAPMAHRVHAHAGVLQRVLDRVLTIGPGIAELEAAEVLTATEAGRFRELYARTRTLAARDGGMCPPQSETAAGFAFLWSDAFEDDGWDGVRQVGRAAFTALRPAEDPWVG
jgi:hypothetical protein